VKRLILVFPLVLSLLGIVAAPADGVEARSPEEPPAAPSRVRLEGMNEGWSRVKPVVALRGYTTGVLHKAAGSQLDEQLENIGDRVRFELQLPDAARLKSRPVEAISYWQADVVLGVEVLYRADSGGRPIYWVAGQLQRPEEDPGWTAGDSVSVPIASRFWKSRTVDGGRGPGQTQVYRYHDGVESWVGAPSQWDAAAAVASMKDMYRAGISPLVVMILGVLIVFILPFYLTWRLMRRRERGPTAASAREARAPGRV